MSLDLLPWAIGGVASAGAAITGYLLVRMGRIESDVQAMKIAGVQGNADLELAIFEKLEAIKIKLVQIDSRLVNIEHQRQAHGDA